LKLPVAVVLAIVCLVSPAFAQTASPPPLYPGLGKTHHKVTTSKAEAQKYFDQGLALTYGFNFDEAYRAYERASQLDPNCAMAYWGMALVLGPNINWPMDPSLEPKAYGHIQRALQLASSATPAERDYIQALAKRYAATGSQDRSPRDSAYTNAMRDLAHKYPDDADAQSFFAESMMDLHPWEYWTHDRKPNPGTEELVKTIETAIAKNPEHVGLIHFYIHAMEAGPNPEKPIPYASKLPALIPGAGHLVHMPTHLSRVAGRWDQAEDLNTQAASVDKAYLDSQKPTGMYSLMYYSHNLHFIAYASSMEGASAKALDAANRLFANVPPDIVKQVSLAEMYTPWQIYVLARFGRWDDILAFKAPPPYYRYTNAMLHYARGLAYAAKKQPDLAGTERDSVQAAYDGLPDNYQVGLNMAKPVLRVALAHLAGEIAMKSDRAVFGIALLKRAAASEDSLHYDEPPAWYAPIRQYLGAAYLTIQKPAEAEKVYREDLAHNPNNGWSLYGLAQALHTQGKIDEANKVDAQFAAAWKRADVQLTMSRF
jgi:tetratricopeptide (TPR) repeat protein